MFELIIAEILIVLLAAPFSYGKGVMPAIIAGAIHSVLLGEKMTQVHFDTLKKMLITANDNLTFGGTAISRLKAGVAKYNQSYVGVPYNSTPTVSAPVVAPAPAPVIAPTPTPAVEVRRRVKSEATPTPVAVPVVVKHEDPKDKLISLLRDQIDLLTTQLEHCRIYHDCFMVPEKTESSLEEDLESLGLD